MSVFEIPTLAEISDLVAKVRASVTTFKSASATFGDKAASVAATALALVEDVAPNLSVAGFAVSKILAIAGDVADEEPTLVASFDAVAAAADGGAAPTAEEWATFNAAADAAHANVRAAIAAFRAGAKA